MKSFAKLLAVAVALTASTVVAHADPITGYVQLAGGDSYTASNITFSNTGNSVFDGNGTLATDFDGGTLVFGPAGTAAGTSYTVDGTNYIGDTLFTITNSSNDVLSFTLSSITSFAYNGDGLDGLEGAGTGTLSLFDPTNNTTSTQTGTFSLSSQEQPCMPGGPCPTGDTTDVSFSSTIASTGVAPTPEPSSLLLLGTGLLGSAGMLYRRSRATSAV